MNNFIPAALQSWQNFYVIVGSSAGALTGLQFVVITLIAQAGATKNMRDIHAFGTPTVIHFCTALLISGVMCAPWPTLTSLATFIGAWGLAGIAYSLRALWHARKAAYKPDLEDWLWYTVLPFLAHVVLVAVPVLMWRNPAWALTTIAADAVFFLFLGVHNAWDTVTYIAVKRGRRAGISQPDTTEPAPPTYNGRNE
ncbi:MAG: hypothetical protein JO061_05935 [Acidobacteriaceae bacterium]|nr:hypothetical protein [Acidobacteriaceae bacterium]